MKLQKGFNRKDERERERERERVILYEGERDKLRLCERERGYLCRSLKTI